MKRIPVIPVPMEKALGATKHLLNWGEFFSNLFPGLAFELEQSEFKFEPREWVALALFTGMFYFSILFTGLFTVLISIRIEFTRMVLVTLGASSVLALVGFMYVIFYPKLYVNRKINQIEKNLPYALHHLLIEVRSGIPLFNALVSISQSRYGILSEEIKKAVDDISTGKSEIGSLELLARRNPSLYFRRVLWQIVNSLKSGADIGNTIKQIVDNLAEEQRVAIKKYGSQLNPLTLMYMIFAVIFPTLGITFILVLSSFVGIGIDLQIVLIGIILFLLLFQFMIIGLIKSKRPVGV
ncbi:MAG TPA: type II secretion system F family protein [archaeon]|nr:type II secretion system F family protein [archaeon]